MQLFENENVSSTQMGSIIQDGNKFNDLESILRHKNF